MKKLQCKKGTTVTEMLCVLIVLSLLSAALVVGVQFGVKVFGRCVSHSEANILCSTLSAALKDELRFAGTITGEGTDFQYFSPSIGENTVFVQKNDGYVWIRNSKNEKTLISTAAYTYGSRAEYTISYIKARNMFAVDLQIKGPGGSVLAENHFEVERLRNSN